MRGEAATTRSGEPVDADAGSRPGARRQRWRQALPALLLALGALLVSGLHVSFYPYTSPVDELAHIDYLYQAPDIVRAGDRVGQEAMREESCRGLPGFPTPPCTPRARYDPAAFREAGANTASVYTPLYYTVTKVLATPLTWLPGVDSLVTGARLVGGLWLAAGLLVAYAAARRLSAPRWPTAAMLLAASATPTVLLPSATITPDATAVLAGATLTWVVLWWETTDRGAIWRLIVLMSVALLVVTLKALNIIVVVLVCCYLLLRLVAALLRRRRSRAGLHTADDTADADADAAPADARSANSEEALATIDARTNGARIAAILVLSTTAVLGAFGYVLLAASLAGPGADEVPMAQQVAAASFPTTGMLDHVGVFLQVLYEPGWFVTVPTFGPFVQTTLALVLFGGTFAAALLLPALDERVRLLGASLLVVGLIGAPLIIAFSYISTQVYVPIPGRYALTLVPAAIATTAAALRTRASRVVVSLAAWAGWAGVVGWLLAR